MFIVAVTLTHPVIWMSPYIRTVNSEIVYSIGPLLLCCLEEQSEMAANLISLDRRASARKKHEDCADSEICLFGELKKPFSRLLKADVCSADNS